MVLVDVDISRLQVALRMLVGASVGYHLLRWTCFVLEGGGGAW